MVSSIYHPVKPEIRLSFSGFFWNETDESIRATLIVSLWGVEGGECGGSIRKMRDGFPMRIPLGSAILMLNSSSKTSSVTSAVDSSLGPEGD